MADYVLSNAADADLDGIYTYSFETFGEVQADAYFLGLRDCLQQLAETPHLGRLAKLVRPDLYRHEDEGHIVFYLIESDCIFIVRILHRSMDVRRVIELGPVSVE
jgi:toxin ParE1/3/4